jgi:hypothetical protein
MIWPILKAPPCTNIGFWCQQRHGDSIGEHSVYKMRLKLDQGGPWPLTHLSSDSSNWQANVLPADQHILCEFMWMAVEK